MSAPFAINDAAVTRAAVVVFVVLPLAVGTAVHAYGLAGGTAKTFLPQQSKLVLTIFLVGIPLALAAVLLDPTGIWHHGSSWSSRSVTSTVVPATAFGLGVAFLLALVFAVLVTWRSGGLGYLPARWWRPSWAVSGLGVGGLLILLGLDDATGFHSVEHAVRLVYVGATTIAVLVIGFVGPVASKRLAGRHQLRH